MLSDIILPTLKLLSTWNQSSDSVTALPIKLMPYFISFQCHFCNFHSIFTRSRIHLKKILSFLIHRNQCPIWSTFNMRLHIQSHGETSLLIPVLFCSHHVCSSFFHWSLELLKVIHEEWNKILPNSLNVDSLTSSHESQMFLMASRMLDLFQKAFDESTLSRSIIG